VRLSALRSVQPAAHVGGRFTFEAWFAFAMLTLESHALTNIGLLKIVQAKAALKHRRLYSPSSVVTVSV
jgi:hypothetical protein